MSGSSALAAAKRRRAVPTAEQTRPNPTPSKPSQIPKQGQPGAPTSQTPPQNPLVLLLQHEQRLLEVEKGVSELNLSVKKPDALNPESLQYFKTQQELLSQEIQELKKIIIKVQTFSMETNLDVLKIKKTLKMMDSTETA